MKFQSTLPARGATPEVIDQLEKLYISIHAPRTGSDDMVEQIEKGERRYFNPRSPHGERPGA